MEKTSNKIQYNYENIKENGVFVPESWEIKVYLFRMCFLPSDS